MIPFGTPPPGSPLPGLFNVEAAYPVIPGPGVMALGYAFGALLAKPRAERRRVVFALGFAATVAFVVLRLGNVYGDPRPWVPRKVRRHDARGVPELREVPAVARVPSHDSRAAPDDVRPVRPAAGRRRGRPFSVYGRVPMFFYVAHLPLIHVLAVVVAAVQSGGFSGPFVRWAAFQSPSFLVPPPPGFGLALPGVYALWLAVVVALYVPCVRYGAFKSRSRAAWTSYI